MFGIGWTEAIFIALILLVFVGPKQLPGMLRRLGRMLGELRKASLELQSQLELETRDLESPGRIADELQREARGLVESPRDEVRTVGEDLARDLREVIDHDTPDEPGDPGDDPGDPNGDRDRGGEGA